MKVGVWISPTQPSDGGGFTIQDDILDTLLLNAKNSEHHYVIFCHPTLVEHKKSFEKPSNVSFLGVPAPSLLQRAYSLGLREFPKLSRMLARTSWADSLFKLHNIDFVWFVSAHPVFTDFPYVTVVWDLQHRLQPWFPEVSKSGEWFRREELYSWFLRKASYVIVGNEVGKSEIQLFYQLPPERIVQLPHPTPKFALDSSSSAEDEKVIDKHSLRAKRFVFYPAQFWPHKNHINLLHAISEVRKKGIDLDLVLSGSNQGNYQHVVSVAKSLGLERNVHFLGFITKGELKVLYKAALALTYISYFGPENLPPLEAFALKCPVIASRVAGSEYQLKDAALFADPSSASDIANAICTIVSDVNLRKQLVDRGNALALAWTGTEFVYGVFKVLDSFQRIRVNWPGSKN